jgi:pyruvate/2-oxoglutarate dehydrogenase complex dihydrolipoamide acyltransferase (E2) component
MSTAGRRRKSTFLTGQDAVAPSITDATAPVAPAAAPEATPQEAAPAPAAEQQNSEQKKGNATDTRRRLQVQMDIDDLAELRSAYNHVAQRGQTLSDFVAGIITDRIHQYRDEVNGGRPFAGAGTVTRGRPPKY